MIKITEKYFDLKQICDSGQCFRMREIAEQRYGIVAFGKYLEMEQTKDGVFFFCSESEFEAIWKAYFDLNMNYGDIINGIGKEDAYLLTAAQYGSGIRILHQDLWEMMVSFIISQQNHIKRIRKCIETICERFGEKKIDKNGMVYFDFPTPKALAEAGEENLRACNLGYRSRYLDKTAKQVIERGDLEDFQSMTYEQARKKLMEFCGIGEKVADCICLFALQKKEAFPIDVHIKRVLEEQYPKGFPFERYRDNAGILQQYIFYYDLTKKENKGSILHKDEKVSYNKK